MAKTTQVSKKKIRYLPTYEYTHIDTDLSIREFEQVMRDFGKFVNKELIAGRQPRIPYFGRFKLYGVKATFDPESDHRGRGYDTLAIDWNSSLALWKEKPELRGKQYVRFMNNHSDNVFYRLEWVYFPHKILPLRYVLKPKCSAGLGLAIKEAAMNREIGGVAVSKGPKKRPVNQ